MVKPHNLIAYSAAFITLASFSLTGCGDRHKGEDEDQSYRFEQLLNDSTIIDEVRDETQIDRSGSEISGISGMFRPDLAGMDGLLGNIASERYSDVRLLLVENPNNGFIEMMACDGPNGTNQIKRLMTGNELPGTYVLPPGEKIAGIENITVETTGSAPTLAGEVLVGPGTRIPMVITLVPEDQNAASPDESIPRDSYSLSQYNLETLENNNAICGTIGQQNASANSSTFGAFTYIADGHLHTLDLAFPSGLAKKLSGDNLSLMLNGSFYEPTEGNTYRNVVEAKAEINYCDENSLNLTLSGYLYEGAWELELNHLHESSIVCPASEVLEEGAMGEGSMDEEPTEKSQLEVGEAICTDARPTNDNALTGNWKFEDAAELIPYLTDLPSVVVERLQANILIADNQLDRVNMTICESPNIYLTFTANGAELISDHASELFGNADGFSLESLTVIESGRMNLGLSTDKFGLLDQELVRKSTSARKLCWDSNQTTAAIPEADTVCAAFKKTGLAIAFELNNRLVTINFMLGETPEVGTYYLSSETRAIVQYDGFTSIGLDTKQYLEQGTLEIDSITESGTKITGDFRLLLPNGEDVSASFDTSVSRSALVNQQ